MATLETLDQAVFNLAGVASRRETLYDREFIVVPATILVEGVLNGSRGSLYYPHQEIARSVGSWNYVPLVYNHPKDPSTGQNISARSAKVLDKDQFGYIFNARFERNAIKCEAWFDIASTKKIDAQNRTDVYQRLVSGQPIELSTGLFTDNEPAMGGAAFNGRKYESIARNYRPDHLAVLPTERGACSINDGCGINVNQCGGDCGCEECKTKNGAGEISSEKACQILHDDEAQGHRLTDSQRKMFATVCKDYKAWKKSRKMTTVNSLISSLITANQETAVAKTKADRKKMVDEIIANCECENEADDRAVLNELSDEELNWTHEFVSNMAGSETPTGNKTSLGKVAQRRILNEMADDEIEEEFTRRKAKNAAADPKKGKKPVMVEVEPEDEEDEEKPVGNAQRIKTRPITVNDLPQELREDIEYARTMKQRERDSMVERLVANVSDPKAKVAQRKRLQSRSLDELRADLELLPVANSADDGEGSPDFGAPIYAGPGPVINRARPAPAKPEPLGQPQWDWDSMSKARTTN